MNVLRDTIPGIRVKPVHNSPEPFVGFRTLMERLWRPGVGRGVRQTSWRHPRCPLVAILAALGLMLNTSLSSAKEGTNYAVADVTLGMDVDSVLEIYPTAHVDVTVPSCYRHGNPVWHAPSARHVLRHRDKVSSLTLEFSAPHADGQLIRIEHDRRVNLANFDFRTLLEKLIRQHGPYNQILHRRKMEPAGRVIGYVWRNSRQASLRVVLHEDFRSPSDRHRLSFLARFTSKTLRQTWCKSPQCPPCITP